MNWYAVHTIMAIVFKRGPQTNLGAYENVLLIRARSPRFAVKKAERISRREERIEDKLRLDKRPAKRIFLGVRKLSAVRSPIKHPKDEPIDGTEITYSFFRVADWPAMKRLARGKSVTIKYLD